MGFLWLERSNSMPPDAGVGSAVGFLRAPFAYEAVRSFYTSTADFDVDDD